VMSGTYKPCSELFMQPSLHPRIVQIQFKFLH
jgi:hypothetical protein